MKKTLTLRLVCLMILASVLFVGFAACGAADAGSGTYVGKYYKFVGDPDSSKVEDEEFTLILKSGGKGTFKRDGEEFDLTWTLDGEAFTMKETFLGISIDYTGTLSGEKLDIFNGDPTDDFTVEYVFELSK